MSSSRPHTARIAERDPEINALVLPRLEAAREEALAADAAHARGEAPGPLHGVPFTAKDPIPVAGMRSPNGSKLLADYVCTEDAEVVRRLRTAGAILLGQDQRVRVRRLVGLGQPALRRDREPSRPVPHGRRLVRRRGRRAGRRACRLWVSAPTSAARSATPATSSGCSACKPGRDTMPFAEHAPLPMSPGIRLMAVTGPMARYVDDLELALDVLAPRTLPAERPERIAVYEDDGLQPVSHDCREAVRRAANALRAAGHQLADEAPPNAAEVRAAYDVVVGTELISALRPFVAGREHELSPYLQEMVAASQALPALLGGLLRRLRPPGSVRGGGGPLVRAPSRRAVPGGIEVAPPLRGLLVGRDRRCAHEAQAANSRSRTYANALGLPAVCVPVMRSPAGLPVGVQLIGRRGSERTLLALARSLEQALGGWLDPDESPRGARGAPPQTAQP